MSAEGMQVLPEGLRDGLMSMKMISLLCHGVESHQISNYQILDWHVSRYLD